MSHPLDKPSLVKQNKPISEEKLESDPSLLAELKEACQSVVARYVALKVPHGSMLSLLVDFALRHGVELVDHWLEDDIDPPSDDESIVDELEDSLAE